MNKKKIYSLVALLFMLTALTMYSVLKKDNPLHDYYWIPMLISAVLLLAATRVK